MDEKEQKFVRLAERRVNDLMEKFRLLGNLADQRNYRYSDSQAKLILKTIDEEVRMLKAKFQQTAVTQKKPFTLL